jgi:murein L,D-transpeptidase YcbB/YkuD
MACSDSSRSELDRSFTPQNVRSVKGVEAQAVRAAIDKRLRAQERALRLDATDWKHVRALYTEFDGAPIWLDHDGLRERRSKTLVTALLNAPNDALDVEQFPLAELTRVLEGLLLERRPSADQLAEVDVTLTATYAALGRDLLTGQMTPRQTAQDWYITRTESQIDSALARILRDHDFDRSITSLRPTDEGYASLQRELTHYREVVARGGWSSVPNAKSLKPGDAAPPATLTALEARLRAEGLLDIGERSDQDTAPRTDAAPSRSVYDSQLAAGVAEFQRRHGIEVDSVLGPQTLRSLNVPAEFRLQQIAANLERYRWLPHSLGARYVFVNVPAFRLEAHDRDGSVLEMKVIVGAEYENRATPVFADSMQFVVFRPYWNATDTIAEKELWPKVEEDPEFLERNDYEIVNENGKQRIRQRPGETNALGLVKFMFPNTFDIYLHDTPEDHLFERDIRAFSHGCIRLEKPAELAQWVLGWPAERVRQAMEGGRDDRRVDLAEKIPVYIVYFTTYVRDGALYFAHDLYQRDEPLAQALVRGAIPSTEVLATVQRLKKLAED